jgi:hypothetical protein
MPSPAQTETEEEMGYAYVELGDTGNTLGQPTVGVTLNEAVAGPSNSVAGDNEAGAGPSNSVAGDN